MCVFLLVLSSIKLELEKLAQEKTEMQRHYVMVSRENFYRTKFLSPLYVL